MTHVMDIAGIVTFVFGRWVDGLCVTEAEADQTRDRGTRVTVTSRI